MGPGLNQTCDPWIYSQTHNQLRILCMQAGQGVTKLCICAGSSKPSLFAYAISIEITHVAPYFRYFGQV